MRVSSTQMIGRYQKQLNDSYEDQTKLMEQSDGSKLHRPSDDSVNYSKFLRYQNSDTENDQYQSNVKNGISWMKTADSAMSQLGTDANSTDTKESAQEDLITQIVNWRSSTSGVDWNEELTNMIKFQKGYSACSRCLTTMDEMLDRLINSTGTVGR